MGLVRSKEEIKYLVFPSHIINERNESCECVPARSFSDLYHKLRRIHLFEHSEDRSFQRLPVGVPAQSLHQVLLFHMESAFNSQ